MHEIDYDTITQIDIRAREHQADELRSNALPIAIHIWPDEQRAYIDSWAGEPITGETPDRDRMYRLAAAYFEVDYEDGDESAVNEALLANYHGHVEDVITDLKAKTIQTKPIDRQFEIGYDYKLHSWQGKDGWYACTSNLCDGNYVESDDFGPFTRREDAEACALDTLMVEA